MKARKRTGSLAVSRGQDLAFKLLDIVPPLMGLVRVEIQASTEARLTLTQYRILSNIRQGLKHVSQIAENQGVSQPAMSKMVEQLAARGLLKREATATDRRHVTLAVTGKGEALYHSVRTKAKTRLIHRLKGMNTKRLTELLSALGELENAFLENPVLAPVAPKALLKSEAKAGTKSEAKSVAKSVRPLRRIQK